MIFDLAARVEPAVPSLLFLAALALFGVRRLARAGARARAARRFEARVSRVLNRTGLALAALAFLLPVVAQQAGAPSSRIPAASLLFGEIPWLDAHGHVEGATRLVAEGRLNSFTERRPFNSPWLALRLALVGLHGALVVQALLLGVSAWVLARAIGTRAGLAAGLAAFALLYGLLRDYAGTPVSEPLGASFAMLAVAALLGVAARPRLALFAASFLLLELALRTRPGAQLLLPCVAAWGVFWLRGRRLAATAVVLGVLLSGALVTRAQLALFGTGQASFSTYPAFTLYGLATRANYVRAKQDFAEEIRTLPETEVSRRLYAAAFQRIRERPQDLALTLVDNLGRFLGKFPPNLHRALSVRGIVARGADWIRPDPAQARFDAWLATPLVMLLVLGAALALWRAPRREATLWLALLLGVLASAPVVYGDAGLRGLVAGLPAIAGVLALGASERRRGPTGGPPDLTRSGAAFALVMLAIGLASPYLVRFAGPPAAALAANEALFDLRLGSAVRVSPANRAEPGTISMREYEQRLSYARLGGSEIWLRRPPFALVSAFDRAGHVQRVVLAPPDFLEASSPFRRARLRPLEAEHDEEAPGEALSVVESFDVVGRLPD